MNTNCNRRNFLRTTVLAGAAISGPGVLLNLLSDPDASMRVYSILDKHLGISAVHMPLVAEYTQSLQTSSRHHLSAQAFQKKLQGSGKLHWKKDADELAVYVIEEFVVSTNYFAYSAGCETNLQMLPAPGASKKEDQRNSTPFEILS